MNKFNFLVGFGLKKRIARKAFIISNIVVFIVMILLINMTSIIALFSGDDASLKHLEISIYNNTTQIDFTEKLDKLLNPEEADEKYYVLTDQQDFDEEYFWKESKADVAIIINGTILNPIVDIYTDDIQLFTNLQNTLEFLIISYEIENYQPPTIKINLSPDFESQEEGMILSSMMSLLILPVFLLVVMATQFVGVDIIEEKSTKAIETIISSVPSNTHFLSKITSSILFVIIQAVLMLVYGFIGITISNYIGSNGSGIGLMPDGSTGSLIDLISYLLPNWPVVIVMALLFVVFGTLLYLVIAALFAAMAVTQEDYQQFQSPLMLILLASFYIALFGSMAGLTTFVKVMSFVPIFSPMLAPVAFASGTITLVEALISLLITIATLLLFIRLFTPVYKVAILSYDQTKFFTRIKNYFKKGFQKPNNNK